MMVCLRSRQLGSKEIVMSNRARAALAVFAIGVAMMAASIQDAMATTTKCPAGKTANSHAACTSNFKAKRKKQGLLVPAVQAARRA